MTKQKPSPLGAMAERAMKIAVRKAFEEHKRIGNPVYLWHKGKVVKMSAARALKLSH